MYSEKTVFLYIDPLIRRFLYSYYKNPLNEPLKFPIDHKIYQLLAFILKNRPRNYDELNNKEGGTEILLPNLIISKIYLPNHFTEVRTKIINNHLERFMHAEIKAIFQTSKYELKLKKNEIIYHVIETFGFIDKDEQVIRKIYDRWINQIDVTKYRKK